MTRLMHAGKSWSGHERNCAYLNLGDGAFVDVSAAIGLDLIDDGRSAAIVDWDADGDLDIWIKNRTGPQLRFMHNGGSGENAFVSLKLTGKTCNRDAIGARVTIRANGRQYVRTLVAGDGYLAQSSKWLHFGLGDTKRIDAATIRWPDGTTQELGHLDIRHRYRVAQGESPVAVDARRKIKIRDKPAIAPKALPPTRIVLRRPLPVPPSLRKIMTDNSTPAGPTLVTLWAHWCAPCRLELGAFAAESTRWEQEGLRVVALNVDKPKDRGKARAFLDSILAESKAADTIIRQDADATLIQVISSITEHVCDKERDTLPLPLSILVSAKGEIQVLYIGPQDVRQVATDMRAFGRDAVKASRRAAFPGRWFFKTPRNYTKLAADLTANGCSDDAAFYEKQ